MKQKTAIRQLIEIVNEMLNNGGDPDLHAVITHAEKLESVNEQQIKDAYNVGESDGINAARYSDYYKYESAEQYITETFEKP